MKLIISFSSRAHGNCDQIASYLAAKGDRIVPFRELEYHACAGCEYECFQGECPYRDDSIYGLYGDMLQYDAVILIVPMYCGNPSSLYFIFHERGQDYFMHNDTYQAIIKKLYIIGIYGKQETAPDFIPCFEKWFDGTAYSTHVLGMERHLYGQKLHDSILAVEDAKAKIDALLRDCEQVSAGSSEAE